jgi:hypothetical protein
MMQHIINKYILNILLRGKATASSNKTIEKRMEILKEKQM